MVGKENEKSKCRKKRRVGHLVYNSNRTNVVGFEVGGQAGRRADGRTGGRADERTGGRVWRGYTYITSAEEIGKGGNIRNTVKE